MICAVKAERPKQTEQWSRPRALFASMLTLLFVWLQVLASSPALHHAIHSDSHQPDHQCVIKLLSQGQVDVAEGMTGVTVQAQTVIAPPVPPLPIQVAIEFRLLPGRAPPSLPS